MREAHSFHLGNHLAGLGKPIPFMGLRPRSNKASATETQNPPGGGSLAFGRRWLGSYSPLLGCTRGRTGSALAALPTARIPRRSTSRNFQTGLWEAHSDDQPREASWSAPALWRFVSR